MGRSQLTTTDKIQRISSQFSDFRRALMRRSDQLAFDRLLATAKNNRLAISQVPDMLPIITMQMTMLIRLESQIEALKQQLLEEHDDDA